MRFIFRSFVLMLLASAVMSYAWHSRFVREGGLSAPIGGAVSGAGGSLRSMLPSSLPSLAASDLARVHAQSRSGEEIFFSPAEDLERVDIGLIREARDTIAVAMYAFTDRAIAQALAQKAHEGVKVWIYRDRAQFEQERAHGSPVMQILRGEPNIHVRIKGSNDLMHDKVMLIDQSTLRGGSGNWSVSAARYQDNQVTVSHAPEQIAAFQRDFTEMWNRRDNEDGTIESVHIPLFNKPRSNVAAR